MAINKILSLESASISWTFKQIKKMYEQGKIVTDNVIQRSYVWEITRRGELIWSTIMKYPIPPLYAKRGTSDNEAIKVYDTLDGQQRVRTIVGFLNDEWALPKLKPIPYLDEEGNEREIDISGKKFSELDEEIQDAITDRTLTVYYYDNINQAQCAEMFRRLNNGKPLSADNKSLASCKNIKELLDIGSHKLFNQCITDKSRDNKNQAIIVMKAWCMLNKKVVDISFETKFFNPMLEEVEISDNEKLELNDVFDFIVSIHDILVDRKEKKVAKKLYTKTHMISLIPFVKKVIENELDTNLVADWIVDFYGVDGKEASKSDDYNLACQGGNAKNMNILTRHDELEASFLDFFKIDEETYYADINDDVEESTEESAEIDVEELEESTDEEIAESVEETETETVATEEDSDDDDGLIPFN